MNFNPKPYLYRGKAHSIRTIHTALMKSANMPGAAMGAERDFLYLRYRDGRERRFPRVLNGDGTSTVTD